VRHVTAQQLSAFLDGALAGVSRELVTRHLAACADCRERHALWHIYDEVLQRVLSWEPNERTMEEASTRVELTLTAERRGLPPPEFTSALYPAIGSTPSPSASGLFPALPPVAPPPPAASPAPVTSAPPPPPAPAPPPSHAPYMPAPSAQSFPLDPPVVAPPVAPPAPPAPVAVVPQFAAASPPPAAAAQWYAPPPPRGYSPPISVHEDLRPHAERHTVQWASVPLPRRKRRLGRGLLICAGLLVAVLLASPWLPDVIRIRLPEGWEPRVPRVEFVPHGARGVSPAAPVATAPDPQLRLAERTSSEPPLVPYRALPAAADSDVRHDGRAEPDSAVRPPALATVHTDAKTHVPARTPARARPRPAPPQETQPEDESGTAAGAEQSMTFVPVQVKTEVRLSSQPSSPPPAAAAADTAGDQALPLLCGVVVDESGAPIEGARVQVMAPALTIRTDKHGRFCVALPAGERTFLVDAAGYSPVTRGVELSGGTFETHVTLAAPR